MRKILVLEHISLDGVIQAPGGPDEDPSGGFAYGGWIEPYSDAILGTALRRQMNLPFDLLLGRKTFEIFSKDLPSKRNFVVSRQNPKYEKAEVFSSLHKALIEAEKFPQDIYIAGGVTIYQQALDLADRMYLSYIKGEFYGDTYFPFFDELKWKLEKKVDYPTYEFRIYSKLSLNHFLPPLHHYTIF